MPPTVSTRNGIEVTWSRCECVMKMWSICESSASVRSPTPVPASIRMSLSTRNEVVRRCRPPIPPEHPSTRRRTRARMIRAERRHAVPAGGGRRAPELADPPGVEPVEAAVRAQALQVDEIDVGLIPVAGAVAAQGLVPELELCVQGSIELAAERLVDGDGFIPALQPDSVHFSKSDLPDHVAPSLPFA